MMILLLTSCTVSAPKQNQDKSNPPTEIRVSPFPYEHSTRLFKKYLKQVASARKLSVPDLPPADGYIGKGKVWQTPYYQKIGEKAGPTVLIVGGTHGHEVAGWIAAQRMLDFGIDRGKLYVIPRVNYRGVAARHRFIPGESDLNRSYPGKSNGNTPDRLAYDVFEFVKEKKVQILLDLHESFGYHLAEERSLGQSIIIYPSDDTAFVGMEVVESLNQNISETLEKITLLQGPKAGSTAWASGKFLGIQGYTLETAIPLPLEKRIEYQILMTRSILGENGIRLDHDSF